MERMPVVSTNIMSAGYDFKSQTMELEFKGGKVYTYKDVPQTVYNGLITAQSAGRFFAQFIKDQYSFVMEG